MYNNHWVNNYHHVNYRVELLILTSAVLEESSGPITVANKYSKVDLFMCPTLMLVSTLVASAARGDQSLVREYSHPPRGAR